MSTVDLTQRLGAFVAGSAPRAASTPALLERGGWFVLDGLGLALAAWSADDRFAQKLLRAQGDDVGDDRPCTIIGTTDRAGAATAALVNGTLIHSWDFEDIAIGTAMHCEPTVLPAALAIAELRGADGAALLDAYIIGAEVAQRLATTSDGIEHGTARYGFHNMSIFGACGAAAAAARLLRLDARRSAEALALAVSFASGSAVGWMQGTARNKPLNAGWAARSGVIAAQMAACGIGVGADTLSGPRGLVFSHLRGRSIDPGPVVDGLGERWRVLDLGIKLLLPGGAAQSIPECVTTLVAEHQIRPDEVLEAEIVLPPRYGAIMALGDALYRPPSAAASFYSVPCTAARIVLSGRYQLEHRTDASVRSPELQALADRFALRLDTPRDDVPTDEHPVTVTITTPRGTVTHAVGIEPGHPRRLDREGVVAKFRECAAFAPFSPDPEPIERLALGLSQVGDVRELTALTRPADRPPGDAGSRARAARAGDRGV
ncbi:MAG TPA: MmgE/PrpD family protein [Baekduia sp.]|uniref:MmgE/PrpD family protein n=1 Tax=Baekduia sp. TaxID=2600305 RepID=UPI002D779864|nr:MmgE/PrpD family protein [Baekduia sp.]HET6508983.1 MmgE/PrpD family protein [Baekduia sp.]